MTNLKNQRGASFGEAERAAKTNRGRIRRDVWISWVVWDGKHLRFVLPANLIKEFGNIYKPTETDIASDDWEIANV